MIFVNSQELVDGITNGELDGGVTEALLAGKLAVDNDWWVNSLPDELARYNLVFGLLGEKLPVLSPDLASHHFPNTYCAL